MSHLYGPNDEKRPSNIPPRPPSEGIDFRSNFRRDYARLVHSPVFRRLQGKTQLFPGIESDFFRNRLTHSIEVAQIAKSIALKLNEEYDFFRENSIDSDIVETAALAHDLGHPPFGHNGELALDSCMAKYGGFEGNAQTLRILAKLEKRETGIKKENPYHLFGVDQRGNDLRNGLNLTFRTLAAILKYDVQIPSYRTPKDAENGVIKGYYHTEAPLVKRIKRNVLTGWNYRGKFKTIECYIMDLADDIAYSTYDLEDAFKAGFLQPLDLLKIATLPEYSYLRNKISQKVSEGIEKPFPEDLVRKVLFQTVLGLLELDNLPNLDFKKILDKGYYVAKCAEISQKMAENGYLRTKFTSDLVNKFIQGVKADLDDHKKGVPPPLYKIYIEDKTLNEVEVLKQLTYEVLISSPMLKTVQSRGQEIVKEIFRAIGEEKDGYKHLPDDFRKIYELVKPKEKKRVICDFIAGMTDRYAIEFYGRLVSENPQTIFKPF